jgi:hypothetical protein
MQSLKPSQRNPKRRRARRTSTASYKLPLLPEPIEKIDALANQVGVSRAFLLEAAIRFFADHARAGAPVVGCGPMYDRPGAITIASDFYNAGEDIIPGGLQVCVVEVLADFNTSWHRYR